VHTYDYHYMKDLVCNMYTLLGPGLHENIYQKAIMSDLLMGGVHCECEKMLPIMYKYAQIGTVRADIIVENEMVIKLKAVSSIKPEHFMQIHRYASIIKTEKMMLINFPNVSVKSVDIYYYEAGTFKQFKNHSSDTT